MCIRDSYYVALSRAIFLKGITPLLLWGQVAALLAILLVLLRLTLVRSRKLGLLPRIRSSPA